MAFATLGAVEVVGVEEMTDAARALVHDAAVVLDRPYSETTGTGPRSV